MESSYGVRYSPHLISSFCSPPLRRCLVTSALLYTRLAITSWMRLVRYRRALGLPVTVFNWGRYRRRRVHADNAAVSQQVRDRGILILPPDQSCA